MFYVVTLGPKSIIKSKKLRELSLNYTFWSIVLVYGWIWTKMYKKNKIFHKNIQIPTKFFSRKPLGIIWAQHNDRWIFIFTTTVKWVTYLVNSMCIWQISIHFIKCVLWSSDLHHLISMCVHTWLHLRLQLTIRKLLQCEYTNWLYELRRFMY